MVEMMDAFEEYLRSCCAVVRACLAYIIRKIMILQTYCDYPRYTTPYDEIIARILHLPQDKNKFLLEHEASSAKEYATGYKIDNKTVYNILDQICKDTDLYPFVKKQKSNGMVEGYFIPFNG